MGDKDIKVFLKEAREQIKNKEFKNALKECKKVLNKDKNNYMALVFCGLSLSELDQPEQAVQAYKRAVEFTPEQVVGWEGLLKFYEKQDGQKFVAHHMEVLQKLMELYKEDASKYFDASSKLAQLQLDQLDLNGAVATLQNQAEFVQNDPIKFKESLGTMIKVLSSQSTLSDAQNVAFKEALEKSMTDNQTPTNMENFKHLIKLLYKVREIDNLLLKAVKMTEIFSENIYPLEWICKVYLEYIAGALDVDTKIFNSIETYFTKLIELSPNSSLGGLAKGAFLWKLKSLEECINTMKSSVESSSSPNFYGLYILALSQFETKDYSAVEVSAAEAAKYTIKVKDDFKREKMENQLSLISIQALYYQSSFDKMERAVSLIESYETQNQGLDYQLITAKIFATVGRADKVEELLFLLKSQVPQHEILVIEALLQKSKKKFKESTELLQQSLVGSADNFEALIILGQLMWEQSEKSSSLPLFLKAAKVNPLHWLPFLYLGHHYAEQGTGPSIGKARKCYSKCLQLNPSNAEAGMALSDIYRTTGCHDENLALLTSVTGGVSASSGVTGWAWLRLGVHYLAVDQPAQAVTALQSALRGDSSSVTCWEALADAYMIRGSYTASRKAFEKVLSLAPDSVYSRLMIAGIKHKLGHYQDAIADYQTLLLTNPDYLPALRGEGESQLALGYSYLDQFVDRNAVDCAESALHVLTRAATVRPGLAGTWRLLGEAGSMLAMLSEEIVEVMVPSKLVKVGGGEECEKMDKQGVMEVAVRCYTKALVLEEDNPGVWHDLALVQAALEQMDKAVQALRKAISLAPRHASLWVSLGLVYARLEDWALAQHCLVRALQLENSALCWTNLGVVYLNLGEQTLANKAFKEAQNAEPSYTRGWTGQALVAEVAGFKSESMDLFRHCTFLGPEPESARGYGDWVCSTMAALEKGQKVEQHNKYILENMFGVVVGVDSLSAYCGRQPGDAVALCQLGVLYEKMGLVRSGYRVMEMCNKLVDKEEEKDKVLTNLGRMLTKLGRCEEAIQHYQAISSTTFYSQVGLAMAHYTVGNYQQAYEAYESCLHWLADNDGLKSHILVAMGSLAYKVEGMQAAKTLLFQSCQLAPTSVRGLFALCVIGVQHSDMNLIEAALSEMVPHETDKRFAPDIAFLRASILVLKGDVAGAKRSLLSFVHKQPWLAKLWSVLSLFLLQNSPRDANAAASLAAKASVMEQSSSPAGEQQDSSSLVLSAIALMMAGDGQASLRQAKIACHQFPHLAHSWAVLAAAARIRNSPSSPAQPWLRSVVEHVRRLGESGGLAEWAERVADSL
eukprot:GFUD01036895.1.p1 GENE.GFUD01036895.1~~GFUD01036895.1.p1  ORF type:complete len:1307 (+),score=422.74 GFUD01036895.1:54-3974(+)